MRLLVVFHGLKIFLLMHLFTHFIYAFLHLLLSTCFVSRVHVCMHIPWCTCRNREKACQCPFFSCTTRVRYVEFKPGMAAGVFEHWAELKALVVVFKLWSKSFLSLFSDELLIGSSETN